MKDEEEWRFARCVFHPPKANFLPPSSFILHSSEMPAEAPVSSIWKKQKFFVSLFLLAVGGWFFWDGAIGYPRSNERWSKHQEFKDAQNLAGWHDYAKAKGWKDEPPHKLFKREDLVAQYVCGGLAALIGVIVLTYWATQIRRVLRTDDEAVYSPAGTRVPFGAITGLGKKRWESKGFATVRYQIDGKQGQFVIDDYKFETEPTRKILAEIESKLGVG